MTAIGAVLALRLSLCLFVLLPLVRPAAAQTIDILAAASTTEAITALAATLDEAHGIKLRATFAASSTLAKHIEAGAPAHLFLSANPRWQRHLENRKLLVPGSSIPLLGNRLVLLHRENAPRLSELSLLAKALGEDRLIMGDPDHVPAGIYGKQALEKLGLWQAVSRRAVYGASVRNALALLARGQGRFAIGYQTDARVYRNVAIAATFPDGSHDAITYPLAIVEGYDSEVVRQAYRFLQGAAAKDVFEDLGFTFLPKPR